MLHCHFADPARLEIAAMLEAGRSDREILAAFEAKHGKRVLMKPPTQGFYLLGWVMPFVGLAIGLLLLWVIVKKFRAIPAPASRTAPPEVMARYRDRVESDTSNLD
jgi:cytochrome c-type biogenesis protein CcmH/NrfF